MNKITSLVLRYKRGKTELEQLKQMVALEVYRFPKQLGLRDQDICGDLLLYVYPKIEAIIARFHYFGTPFDVYLRSVLRYQVMGLYSDKRNRRRRELLFFIDAVSEYENMMYCYATMDVRAHFWAAYRPRIRHSIRQLCLQMFAAGRRLMMFVLKSCFCIRPDQLDAISDFMSIEPAQLQRECGQMREYMGRRYARFEHLRYRCNRAYMRILAIECAIAGAVLESERMLLRTRLRVQMYKGAQVRIQHARTSRAPTNADIARRLGVAVGTVHSSLFYLRRQIGEALNKPEKKTHTSIKCIPPKTSANTHSIDRPIIQGKAPHTARRVRGARLP